MHFLLVLRKEHQLCIPFCHRDKNATVIFTVEMSEIPLQALRDEICTQQGALSIPFLEGDILNYSWTRLKHYNRTVQV